MMIEVNNLTKKFKEATALNGVSFQVNEGEVFAYLGPNGAGKTTTVNILGFFLQRLLKIGPTLTNIMIALIVAVFTFVTYIIATKWFNRERLVVGL